MSPWLSVEPFCGLQLAYYLTWSMFRVLLASYRHHRRQHWCNNKISWSSVFLISRVGSSDSSVFDWLLLFLYRWQLNIWLVICFFIDDSSIFNWLFVSLSVTVQYWIGFFLGGGLLIKAQHLINFNNLKLKNEYFVCYLHIRQYSVYNHTINDIVQL